jgi:hypothetical protein
MFSRWPAAGGFETELDAEQFVAEGQRLVSQLQDELGASYQVEYMPSTCRSLSAHPASGSAGRVANRSVLGRVAGDRGYVPEAM